MTCEVFLDHGADAALLFHGSFGFRELGQNTMPQVDARQHAGQGTVQLPVGEGDLRRQAAGCGMDTCPAAAGAGTAADGDLSVAVNFDYEQAGELKIGQVGIANLRIRTLDVERLVQEMRERVTRAPKLFGRAAVILDFGA